MQIDSSSTSREISFHGLPSKCKRPSIRKQIASPLSSQLIVLLFLRNSHLQRDISQTFFASIFVNFQKIFVAHQKNIQKIFRKFTKSPLVKSYFSKIVGFYRSSHRKCPEKNVLRMVYAEFTGKHLCQGLYFNKFTGLRLLNRDSGTGLLL